MEFSYNNTRRLHNMEALSVVIIAFCKGNPPITCGSPSQRISKEEFGRFLYVSLHKGWTNCWTNSWVVEGTTFFVSHCNAQITLNILKGCYIPMLVFCSIFIPQPLPRNSILCELCIALLETLVLFFDITAILWCFLLLLSNSSTNIDLCVYKTDINRSLKLA